MLTPAATDASSTYYKIGATVTLSWSYTSVQVTPSSIVVQAYCPTNKYPHTRLVPDYFSAPPILAVMSFALWPIFWHVLSWLREFQS